MDEESKNRLRDRFARWQTKTNGQFGFFNNLLLVLSTGVLIFATNQLRDDGFIINNCCAKLTYLLGIFFILLSTISGICLGYNRLKDFKETTRKILLRIKDENDELELLKEQTEYLGKLSWTLLKVQMISFFTGGFVFIVSMWIMFGYKLTC